MRIPGGRTAPRGLCSAAPIEPPIDAVAATVEVSVRPRTAPIQTRVDAITAAVEAPRRDVTIRRSSTLGGAIQATVDAVAAPIQMPLDSIPARIEPLLDSVAAPIRAVRTSILRIVCPDLTAQ